MGEPWMSLNAKAHPLRTPMGFPPFDWRLGRGGFDYCGPPKKATTSWTMRSTELSFPLPS